MSVRIDRPRASGSGEFAQSASAGAPAAGLLRALLWTAAALVLALGASLAGLLLERVYTGAASTAAMLRGYDLVTALLVAPALGVAVWMSRRGSPVGELISASLLAYLIYTYAYYLFGTDFNDLFLLHAAVVATGIVALTLQLRVFDVHAVEDRLPRGVRVRGAGLILGVLAVALGGMWMYLALRNVVTGRVPAGSRLVETDAVVHLGMALDLTLLVPLYAAAAFLLWRRATWGFVLGVIALLSGVLHQVSYVVAMPFQVAADIADAVSFDPAEPVIVLLYLVGLFLLVPPNAGPDPRARKG